MSTARFKSEFTDAQLLDAAIEVIESMSAAGVEKSQRRFDAHRAEAGLARLPRADSICARLGISWSTLVELPSRNQSGRAISFGRVGTNESEAAWVTLEQISFALRLVAVRLNRATVSSADYRRERARIVPAGVRLLPDENQILRTTKSWGAALTIAGLAADDELERDLERMAGVHRVLDKALGAHGVVPSLHELERFAEANGLALPDRLFPYPEVVEFWRETRIDQGRDVPEYTPRDLPRPNFARRVLDGESQRVRRGYWTEALAVEAMRRFLASRRSGEATTRKAYVDWQNGNREAPAASYLDASLGGFARIRQLASGRT